MAQNYRMSNSSTFDRCELNTGMSFTCLRHCWLFWDQNPRLCRKLQGNDDDDDDDGDDDDFHGA